MSHASLRLLCLASMTLVAPGLSWATNCIPLRTTLQAAYADSDIVVVARVSGCVDAQLSEFGHCSNQLYRFDVFEVLKTSISARNHDIVLKGSAIPGCDLSFLAGHEYLLFIDERGDPVPGASAYLNNDDPQSEITRERLIILRQFRDGEIDDLSEPWRFFDHGQACRISHELAGGELTLTFGQAEGLFFRSHSLERAYGPNGEIRLDTAPDVPLEQSFHGEMTGPDYGPGALLLSVSAAQPVHPGSMSIKVGNDIWPLESRTIRLQIGGSEYILISDSVAGRQTAQEIFEAIIEPAEIVILAQSGRTGSLVMKESDLIFQTHSNPLTPTRFLPPVHRRLPG